MDNIMSSIIILANYNYLEDNIRSRVKVSKHIVGLTIHDNSVISRRIFPCWRVLDSLGLVPSGIESKLPSSCTLEMKYTPYFLPSALCPCPIDIIYDSTQNRFIFLSHIIAITILENKSHGYYI